MLVSDSTSVNLFKLLGAAVDAQPGRDVLVCTADDFPTDRYIVAGLARARGMTVREIPADIDEGLDRRCSPTRWTSGSPSSSCRTSPTGPARSRTSRRSPRGPASAGALVLWDLSHSAGRCRSG